MEGGAGGVAEGFGALVRAEGGWGEEVGGLVLKEEMVSLREAISSEAMVSWLHALRVWPCVHRQENQACRSSPYALYPSPLAWPYRS